MHGRVNKFSDKELPTILVSYILKAGEIGKYIQSSLSNKHVVMSVLTKRTTMTIALFSSMLFVTSCVLKRVKFAPQLENQ